MRQEIVKLEPRIRNVDREIAEKAAEYSQRWLALANSIILATSIIEKAETLYTIDIDFTKVEQIKVKAPQMDIKDW